jgi:hypothetical protein
MSLIFSIDQCIPKTFRKLYQGGTRKELGILHNLFPILNQFPRILKER